MSEKGLEEETYSLIFKSLKHPIRRKILRMLASESMIFSEILSPLNIDSGHLSYHLENLGDLITHLSDNRYSLSSFGQAAIRLMNGVEEPSPRTFTSSRNIQSLKIRSLSFILVVILITSLAFSVIFYRENVLLRSELEDSHGFKQSGWFEITYYRGIEKYADAILDICDAAYLGFSTLFKHDLPWPIHIFLIKNPTREQPMIGGSTHGIYLEVTSDDDFLRIDPVIGLIPGLRLILFNLDNLNFNGGFSHYMTFKIGTYVYSLLGENAWFHTYNYSKRIEDTFFNLTASANPGSFGAAANTLYTIDQEYGSELIGEAIYITKRDYKATAPATNPLIPSGPNDRHRNQS